MAILEFIQLLVIHFPEVTQRERERDEGTCSPPRLLMEERNSRLLQSLLGWGRRELGKDSVSSLSGIKFLALGLTLRRILQRFTCLPHWQEQNCNTSANTAQAFLDYVTLVLRAKNRTTMVTNLKKKTCYLQGN